MLVGDEDIGRTGSIYSHRVGVVQGSIPRSARNSVSAVACGAGTRDHGDGSAAIDFEYAMLIVGGDVVVAGAVYGYSIRVVKVGVDRGDPVGAAADRGSNHVLLCQCGETHQHCGQQ